jgi:hypothetical protein
MTYQFLNNFDLSDIAEIAEQLGETVERKSTLNPAGELVRLFPQS